MEKTWNVSIRTMLSLPRNTHRYLLEPLSETPHIIKSIWQRFITFVSNIACGKKSVLKRVLDVVHNDVRSVTGRNLRYLKKKTANFNEQELNVHEKPYKPIPSKDMWRLYLAREIIDSRCGDVMTIMSSEDLDKLAEYVCGS